MSYNCVYIYQLQLYHQLPLKPVYHAQRTNITAMGRPIHQTKEEVDFISGLPILGRFIAKSHSKHVYIGDNATLATLLYLANLLRDQLPTQNNVVVVVVNSSIHILMVFFFFFSSFKKKTRSG